MKFVKRLLALVLVFSFLLIPAAASAATDNPNDGCGGTSGPCIASAAFTNPLNVSIGIKITGASKIKLAPGASSPQVTIRADRFVNVKIDKVAGRTLTDLKCVGNIFIVKKSPKSRTFRLFIPGGVSFNCTPVYL